MLYSKKESKFTLKIVFTYRNALHIRVWVLKNISHFKNLLDEFLSNHFFIRPGVLIVRHYGLSIIRRIAIHFFHSPFKNYYYNF